MILILVAARCAFAPTSSSVVPDWPLSDIYKGTAQFMVLQLIGLALVLAFPQPALWLPAALRN